MKIKATLKKLKTSGFFDIFSSSVINKIVNFAYGIVLVRVISKADYGVYSYAFNIYSYFALFLGAGMSAALLQVCSEKNSTDIVKKEYFSFGVSFSFYFDVVLSLLIIVFASFFTLTIQGSNKLLLCMGLFPLFTQYTPLFVNWLRSNYKNREYARLNIYNSVVITLVSILGAYMYGAIGLVMGRYCAAIATILFAVIKLKCPFPKLLSIKKLIDSWESRVVKIAITLCATESISQIIALAGVSILGVFLNDEEVIAAYKSATIIPTALAFISNAVLAYAYPYFATNNQNYKWTKKNYIKLMGGLAFISTAITLFGIIYAEQIIFILFGKLYGDSVQPFIILMGAFWINSVLRIPAMNLIITQLRLHFCFVMSVIGAMSTIIFNVLLIPRWGSNGAAIAQLLATLIIGFLATGYYIFILLGGTNNEKNNN